MDRTSGPILGKRMLKRAPKKRSERLKRRLERLQASVVAVQDVRRTRSRLSAPNLRPLGKRVDDGWGGLHGTLESQARFVGEPTAAIAQRILDRLFKNGTAFLKESYEAEFLEGETLLARIDKEGMAAEIDSLVGEHGLRYVRSAQEGMGDGLGLGDVEVERADTQALATSLSALAVAIADYIRVLAGETDEDDEKSVARFIRAVVEPIEQHRAYHAKSSSGTKKDDTGNADPALVDSDVVDPSQFDLADDEDPSILDPDAPVPPLDEEPATDPSIH